MLLMQEQNKSHFVDVEFLERFQPAVDPHPSLLRMVPFFRNHVHVFHTIWPSYLRIYATIFIRINLQHNFPKKRGGGRGPFGIFSDLAAGPFP